MEDYAKSNAVKAVGKVSTKTKGAYSKAITSMSGKSLQDFANSLAKDLKITPIKVSYSGQRELVEKYSYKYHKLFTKTKWAITEGDKVKVFKYQAKIKRQVKPTEAIKGLIYEMLKAYDTQVIGLNNSMRTAGYYARFADIEKKLA